MECKCLKPENTWLGIACENWVSISEIVGEEVKTSTDLIKHMKKIRNHNES